MRIVASGGFHVAHLDDVGRRHRVAQQVVERTIGAGDLAHGRALGVGVLAVERAGAWEATIFCPPDSRPVLEDLVEDRVLSVGGLDLSLAHQQKRPAGLCWSIMGGSGPSECSDVEDKFACNSVDSKEDLT